MGIKNAQKNISHSFKIGELIFRNENDYITLKNIDSNIKSIVLYIEETEITVEEFFNRFPDIYVKKTWMDADEELDELFLNTTELLTYPGTLDYEVAQCFFDKIKISLV